MNRIMKFCSSCDEVFSKRIDLCPTCGSALQTFRMESIDDKSERRIGDWPTILRFLSQQRFERG
jgi:predicted amidophosphoribosyltransferase